ncbi:hypothetical protein ETAA8_45150 [Anatilimnocola aggregata]|uniref:Uncharacterized protein n=1 Tax=Anatilimnocola aggregata TaxID=2528021 RepID=A0A517YGP8_9BACT|nr:hypothetical protein ETAA8_45150 [Anatilimnocola aggregata]
MQQIVLLARLPQLQSQRVAVRVVEVSHSGRLWVCKVLRTTTLGSFLREFSPLGVREAKRGPSPGKRIAATLLGTTAGPMALAPFKPFARTVTFVHAGGFGQRQWRTQRQFMDLPTSSLQLSVGLTMTGDYPPVAAGIGFHACNGTWYDNYQSPCLWRRVCGAKYPGRAHQSQTFPEFENLLDLSRWPSQQPEGIFAVTADELRHLVFFAVSPMVHNAETRGSSLNAFLHKIQGYKGQYPGLHLPPGCSRLQYGYPNREI